MGDTKIEWTDKSWSPLRAQVKQDAGKIAKAKGYKSLIQIATKMAGHIGPHCEHVSDGCKLCYSDTNNHRCLPKNGTGLPFDRRSRDLVDSIVDEKILLQPLKWKQPQRVFVENQSDLFGEWVTDEQIDRAFAVMALSPRHTFQVLTKRPERMLNYMFWDIEDRLDDLCHELPGALDETWHYPAVWPLPNVWLGVSCEDQPTAEKRSATLRQIPAAIRFISQEPQLSEIDWKPGMLDGIHWLVQGGESGRGARPFDIDWARKTRDQCKAAKVAYFLKQLGARPYPGRLGNGRMPDMALKSRKGGDMQEWPEDLRIREFPA